MGPLLGAVLVLCAGAPGFALDARPVWNPVVPEQIAVLPVHNLSLRVAPLEFIRQRCAALLAERGLPVADAALVDEALYELRLRYVGGVSGVASTGLFERGIDGVIVLTLDQYQEDDPPRVGLQARLVSLRAGEPRVLLALSVAVAGDETAGLFESRRVRDPAVVVEQALLRIADGMAAFNVAPVAPRADNPSDDRGKFAPRSFFASPAVPAIGAAPLRIAVLPFIDETPRRGAGEIVALHVANELLRVEGVEIVEPGQVRQVLLDTRTVQEGGLSLPQVEVLRAILDVDMVVTGRVAEYLAEGGGGPPRVALTAQGVDAVTRQVVWVARSESDGRKGVFFFNAGAVWTVHELVVETARAMIAKLVREARRIDRTRARQGAAGKQ